MDMNQNMDSMNVNEQEIFRKIHQGAVEGIMKYLGVNQERAEKLIDISAGADLAWKLGNSTALVPSQFHELVGRSYESAQKANPLLYVCDKHIACLQIHDNTERPTMKPVDSVSACKDGSIAVEVDLEVSEGTTYYGSFNDNLMAAMLDNITIPSKPLIVGNNHGRRLMLMMCGMLLAQTEHGKPRMVFAMICNDTRKLNNPVEVMTALNKFIDIVGQDGTKITGITEI